MAFIADLNGPIKWEIYAAILKFNSTQFNSHLGFFTTEDPASSAHLMKTLRCKHYEQPFKNVLTKQINRLPNEKHNGLSQSVGNHPHQMLSSTPLSRIGGLLKITK